MAVGTRMQQRRATEAVWNTSDYVLAQGELGVTTDTGIIKVGDGVNGWSALDPAFDSHYLPILGKAADSELLDGISSENFVKVADTSVSATADKYVKRTSTGQVKAANAGAADEAVTLAQLSLNTVSRTLTANGTLALTDAGKIVFFNNGAYSPAFTCTVPTNASVAFPVGSYVDIVSSGKGAVVITPAGGVTVNGQTVIYGGGSSARLIKTATDTWQVVNVCLSPAPILRRIISDTTNTNLTNNNFTKLNLDGANRNTFPYSNNKDSLGTEQQWLSSAVTKCYCQREGWYNLRAQASINPSAGGRAFIEPRINNTETYLGTGIVRGSQAAMTAMTNTYVPLNVGDYVEFWIYQDSGSTAAITEQLYAPSFVEWIWHRPL